MHVQLWVAKFYLEKQKEIFLYEQRFVENIANHFGYLKKVHCFSTCRRKSRDQEKYKFLTPKRENCIYRTISMAMKNREESKPLVLALCAFGSSGATKTRWVLGIYMYQCLQNLQSDLIQSL